MLNSTDIKLNEDVFIVQDNNLLKVNKKFAELNLTKEALNTAHYVNGAYLWDWGTTSYVVAFELPRLFRFTGGAVVNNILTHCNGYILNRGIAPTQVYPVFLANLNKNMNSW